VDPATVCCPRFFLIDSKFLDYAAFKIEFPRILHQIFRKPIDEKLFLDTAVETLVHPEAISLPVNLIKVQANDRQLASFLSIGWGLMSDIVSFWSF
jgi:hypothetical protein